MRAGAAHAVRGVGGVRLTCFDLGGCGPAVLLLHGLGGNASEWQPTAAALAGRGRVLALDQRGHGESERPPPGSYGTGAFVGDVVAAVEQLGLAPVVLVGQSLGGLHAYLAAARRPELVRALVIVEAQASPNPEGVAEAAEWLGSLPESFQDGEEARRTLAAAGFPGEEWRGLVEPAGPRWRLRFDVGGALEALGDLAERDHWREWRTLSCPVLVVGGTESGMDQDELRAMAAAVPHGGYVAVTGAGHNVHLDRPGEWTALLTRFLDTLPLALPGSGAPRL